MSDKAPPTLSTFGPDASRAIAAFVANEIRTTGRRGNDTISRRIISTKHCFAKITDTATTDGVAYQAWKEARWSFTDEQWEDAPDGRTGTTSANQAIGIDATSALNIGEVYLVIKQTNPDTGANLWVAVQSASSSVGEFQWQELQMVSANQSGWGFAVAHALP